MSSEEKKSEITGGTAEVWKHILPEMPPVPSSGNHVHFLKYLFTSLFIDTKMVGPKISLLQSVGTSITYGIFLHA